MKFLVSSIILSLLVVSSSALKCYQCVYYENNNTTQTECEGPSSSEDLLRDCESEEDSEGNTINWQCLKKDGITIDDELKYIERSCSPTGNSTGNSCKESNALDTPYGLAEKASKCFCNTDGCNGVGRTSVSMLIFVPVILSTFATRNFL